MATSRAFTKNLGAPIFGTAQVGNIAYTLPGSTIDFTATGLKWYNGPDEDANPAFNFANAGYVICAEGSTSSPDGTTSPIKFYRSNDKTESSFINLVEGIIVGKFLTGNDAAAALTNAGYFSSWETTQQNITYTQISWYRDRYLDQLTNCPTMAEGQNLYIGSDNKIYWNQNGSLFSTELGEGLVDQDGIIGGVMDQPTGRVYTVSYGLLSATSKSCAIL